MLISQRRLFTKPTTTEHRSKCARHISKVTRAKFLVRSKPIWPLQIDKIHVPLIVANQQKSMNSAPHIDYSILQQTKKWVLHYDLAVNQGVKNLWEGVKNFSTHNMLRKEFTNRIMPPNSEQPFTELESAFANIKMSTTQFFKTQKNPPYHA